MKKAISFPCGLILIVASLVSNQTFATQHLHENIYQAVKTFIHKQVAPLTANRIEIKAGPLDPQLKLTPCDKPLDIFLPPQTPILKSSSVGVRCPSSNWSLYVPVKVQIIAPILITTKTLGRKQIIQSEDLKLIEMDVNRLTQGYFDDPNEVVGKMTRYNLQAGLPIERRHLMEPLIIRKGDVVTITAHTDQLTVSTKGVALQNGSRGDLIRVTNIKSGKALQVIAKSPYQVYVPI